MTSKPENEPFIAPSADSRQKNVKKGLAGRGLMMTIILAAAIAFSLYLVIIVIGTTRALT